MGATRYLYWLEKNDFLWARKFLEDEGFELAPAVLTPCQELEATGDRVLYAAPGVCSTPWSRPRPSAQSYTWSPI